MNSSMMTAPSFAPRHQRGKDGHTAGGKSKALFSLLFICFFMSLLSSVSGETKLLLRVSRLLDDEMLDACNESILLSDEDGDGALDSTEFTTMIEILTDGEISVDKIADLPLRLRTVFYMYACACALQPGASSDCCVGDNSKIPVDEVDSDSPTMANRVFCGEVTRGIADVEDDFSPTATPATMPTSAPSMVLPTSSPSPSATPPETLCISFQYELMNNQSLSADDIMNENGNSLKSGLIEATRTTVINILNETYPRTDGSSQASNRDDAPVDAPVDNDVEYIGQVMLPSGHYRKLLQAAEQADAFALDMDLTTYYENMRGEMASMLNSTTTRKSRRLHYLKDKSYFLRQSRRLVYYSDEFPVEITQVADSTTCPGSGMNEEIRCAVVSSTVCVVLEPGDNPAEIRSALMQGLEEAITSGEFVDNIPPGATSR